MSHRPEVHRRFLAVLAERHNAGGDGRQRALARRGDEIYSCGTSYAVWVGVDAVGTAILGIVLFGESASLGRLFSLGLIVAIIVGLKLATPS